MKYFKPKSLTWWSGAALIITGAAQIALPDSFAASQIGAFLSLLTGGSEGASPALLMASGTGLIGLRAAPGVVGR